MPTAPAILPTAIAWRARTSARSRAHDLGVPAREHQAGGDRLGVDAVRAADHRRRRVLARRVGEHAARSPIDAARGSGRARAPVWIASDVSSTSDDVMPEVQPARRLARELLDVGQERDDVVARGRLDLEDARGIELAARRRRGPARGARRARCPRAPSPRRRRARSRATARSDTCLPRVPRARVDCIEGSRHRPRRF